MKVLAGTRQAQFNSTVQVVLRHKFSIVYSRTSRRSLCPTAFELFPPESAESRRFGLVATKIEEISQLFRPMRCLPRLYVIPEDPPLLVYPGPLLVRCSTPSALSWARSESLVPNRTALSHFGFRPAFGKAPAERAERGLSLRWPALRAFFEGVKGDAAIVRNYSIFMSFSVLETTSSFGLPNDTFGSGGTI